MRLRVRALRLPAHAHAPLELMSQVTVPIVDALKRTAESSAPSDPDGLVGTSPDPTAHATARAHRTP